MATLKERLRRHKRPLVLLFYSAIIILVVFIAKNEISDLSGEKMRTALIALPAHSIWATLGLGLLAFTATGLYDAAASRHFNVDLSLGTSAKIGWISQAFNNFAGLGGLTGGTIRAKYYQRAGADSERAINVTLCVWAANLVGLFLLLLLTLPFGIAYDRGLWFVPAVACLYIPLYFYGGGLKVALLKPLRLQTFRQKLTMTVASVLDWGAAAVFFWWCLELFIDGSTVWGATFVYATATLVGLLSFVPAGLGTFDVTCITLLTAMGHDSSGIVLAIVIYRVAYYLIPWILSTIYWLGETLLPKLRSTRTNTSESLLINVLWLGVLTSGILLIFSVLTPDFYNRVRLLSRFSPRFVHEASGITTLLVGVMLIVLAWGIRARVARVYPVCMGLLVIGALASLMRGLNYEEAIYLSIFALLLYHCRKSFVNAPLRLSVKNFTITFLSVVGIPLMIFLWKTHHSHNLLRPYPRHHPGNIVYHATFYALVVIVIAVLLLFSRGQRLEFVPPTRQDAKKFEEFLEKHGGNEYSHLFFLGDKQVFYSSDNSVALLYRPDNNNLVVLGDPIGDESRFENAIDEFVRMGESHRMNVAIYELSARHLATCADQGFTFVKIGEDASVNLSTYSNVGNKGKVFRRMRNRMGEKGTHFEMVEPPFSNEFLAELRDVSDSWLGKRSELGFSLGAFNVDYLNRAPVAIVRGEERIEGFASLMPSRSGVASVDLMRIRPDAPGGTMDGIFVSLIEWARDSGYQYFNLGMAPMSNTGNAVYSGSKQKVIRYIYDFGNRAYNFHGLRSYKEKFRPLWTSRYLVYRNASVLVSTLLSILSVIHRPTTAMAIGRDDLDSHLSPTETPRGQALAHVPSVSTQQNQEQQQGVEAGDDTRSTHDGEIEKPTANKKSTNSSAAKSRKTQKNPGSHHRSSAPSSSSDEAKNSGQSSLATGDQSSLATGDLSDIAHASHRSHHSEEQSNNVSSSNAPAENAVSHEAGDSHQL